MNSNRLTVQKHQIMVLRIKLISTKERGILEPGDFEKALTAAQAIGDDALQRRAQGYEVPESFTHGTSEQRMRWLRRGYEQGTLEACDTIRAKEL